MHLNTTLATFLLVFLTMICGSVNAQDDPFSVSIPAREQAISYGKSVVLTTLIDVKEARSTNVEVCSVEKVTPRQISLQGLQYGRTTVTFFFNDENRPPVTYEIDVVTDPNAYNRLAAFVLSRFPNSRIQITPVPTSNKVIVEGTASNSVEAAEIIQLIVSDKLPREQIINKIAVPCVPCLPRPVPCAPSARCFEQRRCLLAR